MSRAITANSTQGRILLALRAGRMDFASINERFPSSSTYLGLLREAGYFRVEDGFYVLTELGRRSCPSRRAAPLEPLHGTFWNKTKQQGASA